MGQDYMQFDVPRGGSSTGKLAEIYVPGAYRVGSILFQVEKGDLQSLQGMIDRTLAALRGFPDYERETETDVGTWTRRPHFGEPAGDAMQRELQTIATNRIRFSISGGGDFQARAVISVYEGYARYRLADSNTFTADDGQLLELRRLIQETIDFL